MSVLREEHLDLAAGYALGTLAEPERVRLEALLAAGNPELEEAVREMSSAAGLMAHGVAAAKPSPALRSRVLAAARAESGAGAPADSASRKILPMPQARRREWSWASGLGWAVAAGLLMVSWLSYESASRLKGELGRVQLDLTQLRQNLESERRWSAIAALPTARAVKLDATPSADTKLAGRVAYDPVSRKAVLLFDHFTAPSGKDYELWAIRDGKPAALGLVHPDAEGHAVIELADAGEPQGLGAFAISLEPAGGSPHQDAPSGPVVMVAKLAG